MDRYEYVVSEGEGTLLDHGRCDYMDLGFLIDDLAPGQNLAIAVAGEDCETGI